MLSTEKDFEDFLRAKSKAPLRSMLERSPIPREVAAARSYDLESARLLEQFHAREVA